jgi:hypothetical protein
MRQVRPGGGCWHRQPAPAPGTGATSPGTPGHSMRRTGTTRSSASPRAAATIAWDLPWLNRGAVPASGQRRSSAQSRRSQPLGQPDGTTIQPTGKPFDVLYSTAARWKDGKIVEEYLFYDNGTSLTQIGLADSRLDGHDSTPIPPWGQRGQRRGPRLAGTGCGDGRQGGRELVPTARTWPAGQDVPPEGRHPHARHGCWIRLRSPRLHHRHLAAVGRHRPPGGYCDRRVGAADQRAAARAARSRCTPPPVPLPGRPGAARALPAVRGRRPQPAAPGAQRAQLPRRDRPRTPRHQRAR